MRKGKLLKSMLGLGIGSHSSKLNKKPNESCKNKFDESLLKDSLALISYRTLVFGNDILDELRISVIQLSNQISTPEYLDSQFEIIVSCAINDVYKETSDKHEEYLGFCSQLLALISVEYRNFLVQKTPKLLQNINTYLNNDEKIGVFKKDIKIATKNIDLAKKNTKHSSSDKTNNCTTEEIHLLNDKLADQIHAFELYLIELLDSQREMADILIDDVNLTREYHLHCCNSIGRQLYQIENIIYENINNPILGVSLRKLRTSFKQDISIFLSRTFRFLVENDIQSYKIIGIFDEPSENIELLNQIKESLLAGKLLLNQYKDHLNVVARSVVVYLQELPLPLIHVDEPVDWSEEATKKNYVQRCFTFRNVVNNLPYLHRLNLLYLIAFFGVLVRYSADSHLTANYLAETFVNCLFSPTYLSKQDIPSLKIILCEIIKKFNTLFPDECKRFTFGLVSDIIPASQREISSMENEILYDSAFVETKRAPLISHHSLDEKTRRNSLKGIDSTVRYAHSDAIKNIEDQSTTDNCFEEEVPSSTAEPYFGVSTKPSRDSVVINIENIQPTYNMIDNKLTSLPRLSSLLISPNTYKIPPKSINDVKQSYYSSDDSQRKSGIHALHREQSVSYIIHKYNLLSKMSDSNKKYDFPDNNSEGYKGCLKSPSKIPAISQFDISKPTKIKFGKIKKSLTNDDSTTDNTIPSLSERIRRLKNNID